MRDRGKEKGKKGLKKKEEGGKKRGREEGRKGKGEEKGGGEKRGGKGRKGFLKFGIRKGDFHKPML